MRGVKTVNKSETLPHDYLNCKGTCTICASREQCIGAACDGLTASVRDRRENGGTQQKIRARALDLIRVMVDDLET